MAINVGQDQDEQIESVEVERQEVQVSPKEAPKEVKPSAPAPVEVDSWKVRVTDGIKFMWRDEIIQYRRGDIIKVSKDLFDILWKRGVITLEP